MSSRVSWWEVLTPDFDVTAALQHLRKPSASLSEKDLAEARVVLPLLEKAKQFEELSQAVLSLRRELEEIRRQQRVPSQGYESGDSVSQGVRPSARFKTPRSRASSIPRSLRLRRLSSRLLEKRDTSQAPSHGYTSSDSLDDKNRRSATRNSRPLSPPAHRSLRRLNSFSTLFDTKHSRRSLSLGGNEYGSNEARGRYASVTTVDAQRVSVGMASRETHTMSPKENRPCTPAAPDLNKRSTFFFRERSSTVSSAHSPDIETTTTTDYFGKGLMDSIEPGEIERDRYQYFAKKEARKFKELGSSEPAPPRGRSVAKTFPKATSTVKPVLSDVADGGNIANTANTASPVLSDSEDAKPGRSGMRGFLRGRATPVGSIRRPGSRRDKRDRTKLVSMPVEWRPAQQPENPSSRIRGYIRAVADSVKPAGESTGSAVAAAPVEDAHDESSSATDLGSELEGLEETAEALRFRAVNKDAGIGEAV